MNRSKKRIRKVFDAMPFKKHIFGLLKKVWHPKQNIYKHLHFKGEIKIPVESLSFKMHHYGYSVENEVFWSGLTGNWEKVSLGLWIELAKKSEVVFDIGANTGIYALVAKTLNPKAKVYAFEPVKRVFDKLQYNIALNGYDISVYQKAISNFDGTARFYDTLSEHIYSVTINRNLNTPEVPVAEVSVEAVTLNSFIRMNGIEKIDLIKIDVETHEPEVLEGFSEYLEKFKPTILIEILNDEIGEKVHNLVRFCNYLYFDIDEGGKINRVDKITQKNNLNYLLCSRQTANDLGLPV